MDEPDAFPRGLALLLLAVVCTVLPYLAGLRALRGVSLAGALILLVSAVLVQLAGPNPVPAD